MKLLRRAGWSLLALLLMVALAAGIYATRSFPQLDGELKTPGLAAAVQVQRDASDVTHIRAKSARDAWFSLGYVHAQERGWQLEFNRRVMHGELSELFGESTLDTDKLMRTLGIMPAARAQLARLPAEAQEAVRAYAEGINTFHASSSQALPPEFHILRTQPGGGSGPAWTAEDSVGWSIMMALDLGGNWGTEFARLSNARGLPTERLWQLFPPYPGEPPASRTDFHRLYNDLGIYRAQPTGQLPNATKSVANNDQMMRTTGLLGSKMASEMASEMSAEMSAEMALWAAGLAANAGNVEGKGSNNWVVAGSHTTSGKPLLANDPHLGLTAPAIWYFAGLHAPGLEVVGATLPGLPFVVLGRTEQVAWGFTNTGPDVQDLYLEQINPANPAQYKTPDGWAAFGTRTEVIKVAKRPDVTLPVRSTRHGPVLSDAQAPHGELLDTQKFVLALRWSALDADNQTVDAGLKTNRAQTVEQMVAAAAGYHSPMQNVVIADTAGKIAFKAIGKTPLRHPDNDIRGVAPSPGWEARYDWQGYLPYADNPQDDPAETARKGFIATANQRITVPGYPHFMGQDWAAPYRFDRIEQLLAAVPKHSLDSMREAHADQLSLATQRLLPHLQKTASAHALAPATQAQLKGFDGVMRPDSAAPLVFAVWADELARGLIAPRIGEARFKAQYGKRHFRGLVEQVLETNDAWWCAPKSCAEQSGAALDRALNRLQALYGADVAQWQWGRAHPALSTHRPFSNVGPLARWFDVQVPTGGDPFTVNVGQYWPNDPKTPFANRHAASMRAVYDLANLENSRFIYQTGQSGLVFSSRYRDMSEGWAKVQYRALRLNPAEWRHNLVLMPN